MYVHVFFFCLLLLLVRASPKIQKRLLTDLALPKIRRGLLPPRGRRFDIRQFSGFPAIPAKIRKFSEQK